MLDNTPFLDLVKPFAKDLVAQHYFPADSAEKANLLIMIDWGVTTVADSTYAQLGQDTPMGAADTDASRRDTMHQMAVTERGNGNPTASVQMMDQTYGMNRVNGLISDSNLQALDQK